LLAEGQVIDSGIHQFYLDSRFFLQNTGFTITQVRVDFGDGQGEWVVNNPFSGGGRTEDVFINIISKLINLDLIGRIDVVARDLLGNYLLFGNPFHITVKKTKQYHDLTICKGLQQWVIDPDPSALALINAQYGNPQVDYKNLPVMAVPAILIYFINQLYLLTVLILQMIGV
jgi:hypothetical protein